MNHKSDSAPAGPNGGADPHSQNPEDWATPYAKASYRYYVLGILTLVYAFNFIDRQLLVILQEPIQAELGLSDTQLGLLTGFAFAVFYVVCGIPIARWADKGVRRSIIALALAVWSLMTAVSGLAQNYTHLLLARIGVGVGEAGGSPPAHSMISDIFDRKHRATALSIYSVGIYIGILAGFMLGGWITEFFGWRLAFFVVGLPGVALAILFRLSVSEPVRGWSEGRAHRVDAAPPVAEVMRLLWSRRSFRHIAMAASLQALIIYGIGNWLPSYFLRTHDIGIGQLGTWMALTTGFGGGLGSFFGGWIADRLGARDPRWYLWAPALLVACTAPLLLVMLTTDALYPALLLVGPFNFAVAAYLGAVLAVSHNLVELRVRALTSAILFFMINLIGMGIGPVSVGALSDYLTASGAAAPLGSAMMVVGVTAAVWAVLHYLLATRHLREELEKA
ncbi:MAG TPA: MFS transporter [Xanthomonadales bacterium]|nr:MFS transporter [Xanthomonadales bacterium]